METPSLSISTCRLLRRGNRQVFIPLGKALAEGMRRRGTLPFDAESRLMHRLERIEAMTASIAAEVQKQSENQRTLDQRLSTLRLHPRARAMPRDVSSRHTSERRRD